MDHDHKVARAAEIQRTIAQTLLHDWDPIGVQDVPQAQSEYDRYVGSVYRLLASGMPPRVVAEHLARIQDEEMGLSGGRVEDLLPVAEALCRIDVRIERA